MSDRVTVGDMPLDQPDTVTVGDVIAWRKLPVELTELADWLSRLAGDAWDHVADGPAACPCECHTPTPEVEP